MTRKIHFCRAAIALPAAIIGACQNESDKIGHTEKSNEPQSNWLVQQAQEAVKESLRDPDSAKFRRTVAINSNTVCGEVNGRNGFGGYAGFQPFIWDGRTVAIGSTDTLEHIKDPRFNACLPPQILDFAVCLQEGKSPDACDSAPNSALSSKEAEREQKSTPSLKLHPLSESDLGALGRGCMCAFSEGDGAMLYVNRDHVVSRPNGRPLVSRMDSDTFDQLYNASGNFRSGAYSIAVETTGEPKSGYEAHATPSRLTVQSDHAKEVINGTWSCGC